MSSPHRPHLPWSAGCRLVPPSEGAPELVVIGLPAFRTLPGPGIVSAGSQQSWALDFGLGSREDLAWDVTAHGLRAVPSAGGAPLLELAVPEAGVLVFELEPGHVPLLSSAEGELQQDGDTTFLELPDATVTLRTTRRGGRAHGTLLYDPSTQVDAARVARRWHDLVPAKWLEEALAPYDAFWHRQAALPPDEARVLAERVRELMSDLRAPAGPLSLPWCAARSLHGLGMRVDQLYPLVNAWLQIRPRVAMNLVKNVLANQRLDGSIPAILSPDSRHEVTPTPPPVLVQCALRVWRAEPNRDFFDFALPALHRFVRWAVRYFDPDDRAQPHWQEADEAFVPGTYDANLASADLLSFLVCEIDALVEMGQAVAVGAGEYDDLLSYRRRLMDTLVRFLWDEAVGAFRDRYIGGPHIARLTLAAALPLRIPGLAADFLTPLLAWLQRDDGLHCSRGLRAWMRWEGDAEEPPVLAAHQIMMLDALVRHGDTEIARSLRTSLLDGLRAPPVAPVAGATPGGRAADPADADALAVLLIARSAEGLLQTPELSALVRWAEEHRRTVITAAGVALIILMGAIFLGTCARRLMTVQAMETTAGLARRYFTEARYDEAEKLYREIIDSGRYFPGLYFSLGNVMYRQERWDEAEALYRREIEKSATSYGARLNLALTLLQNRKTNEAIVVWRQITNDLSVSVPAAAARAATAIQLLTGETPPPEKATESRQSSVSTEMEK